ncbi:MAG: DUF4124 domain-containing protein, partial [Gammaproteobacteria bacterium]|nr:DUF4124 domain-containing protein [Gammaproteobacteria bacterium]
LLMQLCLITLCVHMPSLAMAEVYKWVDDEGKINYTQSPPPPGYESETIRQAPSPAVTPDTPESRLERLEEEQKDLEKDAATAKQEKENAEIRQFNCDAATRNLEVLEKEGQRRYMTAKGELLRPTDKERQQLIDEARQQIEENCTQ